MWWQHAIMGGVERIKRGSIDRLGQAAYTECMENLGMRTHAGGWVQGVPESVCQLGLPAGAAGVYRWAQLDDYLGLPRARLLHHPPLRMELRARVSASDLPGTWGFGFWNDPFSAGLGLNGMTAHLPALPDAAWFFFASPHNYLAFQDHHPAQGFLAATFASARLPAGLLALGGVALPLLAIRPGARMLRRILRRFIQEDAAHVPVDPTNWHAYRLDWQPGQVRFWVDGALCFATHAAPRGPLGLVIWIDNQFAAFPPSGKLSTGTLANPALCWLEIADLSVTKIAK